MTDAAVVRARALGPALYSTHMPPGVLHSTGIAEWTLPQSIGGGYMHYLRTLDLGVSGKYEDFIAPITAAYEALGVGLSEAFLVTRSKWNAYVADVLGAYGTLDPADLAAGQDYDHGSALFLQGLVWAPSGTVAPFDSHDYGDDITDITAEWSKTIYAHLGAANNDQTPTGSFELNNAYPLITRTAGENPNIVAVDRVGAGLAADAFVMNTGIVCTDLAQRTWYHPVLDICHPDVAALIISQAEDFVTAYTTTMRYVVHGESSLALGGPVGGFPLTAYPTRYVTGFQRYIANKLGLTVAEVNERWGKSYQSIDQVEPRSEDNASPSTAMVEDWRSWMSYLSAELALQTAHSAKGAENGAQVSVFRFGTGGLEASWLESDYGSVGDWHGESEAAYLAQKTYFFQGISSGASLSGVPAAFPFTICPGTPHSPPIGSNPIPPLLRAFRTYTENNVKWLFRELLTCGAVGLGYLKTVGFSFQADATSKAAMLDTLDDMEAIRVSHLQGMGAYQRYVIHAGNFAAESNSGGVVAGLGAKLRKTNTPYATISDTRTMSRTLAQWWLKRSFVVATYRDDTTDLIEQYVDLFPDGAPGAALLLSDDIPLPQGYAMGSDLLVDELGSLHRVVETDGDVTNVWVFRCSERRACRDLTKHGRMMGELIESQMRPMIMPEIAQSAADPFVISPLLYTNLEVIATVVSDGVNFVTAVSNMTSASGNVTITVDPRIATALDVTYTPEVVALASGETKFVLLQATPSVINLQTSIADGVTGIGDGSLATYAAAHKTAVSDLLNQAEAHRLATGRDGRALACYIEACRQPILKAVFNATTVVVNARRIGVTAEAAVVPITGARVQITFPLNGGEEQVVEGVTDGSGDCTIVVGSPVTKRWDFQTSQLVDPAGTVRNTIEVHVTDAATGASARLITTNTA